MNPSASAYSLVNQRIKNPLKGGAVLTRQKFVKLPIAPSFVTLKMNNFLF
jgi:hypothetical protein